LGIKHRYIVVTAMGGRAWACWGLLRPTGRDEKKEESGRTRRNLSWQIETFCRNCSELVHAFEAKVVGIEFNGNRLWSDIGGVSVSRLLAKALQLREREGSGGLRGEEGWAWSCSIATLL
jgi:hypothetical protein